jgi:hypothetical protein
MRRANTVALVLASCAAAPELPPISLELSGIAPSEVGAVQVTVLGNAQRYVCREIISTCLAGQKATADIVPIRGPDGVDRRSLRVKLTSSRVLGEGEPVTLDLPAGSHYMVVAEVLSTDETKLLASGCDVRSEVPGGDNPPLAIRAAALEPIPACDPQIQ